MRSHRSTQRRAEALQCRSLCSAARRRYSRISGWRARVAAAAIQRDYHLFPAQHVVIRRPAQFPHSAASARMALISWARAGPPVIELIRRGRPARIRKRVVRSISSRCSSGRAQCSRSDAFEAGRNIMGVDGARQNGVDMTIFAMDDLIHGRVLCVFKTSMRNRSRQPRK